MRSSEQIVEAMDYAVFRDDVKHIILDNLQARRSALYCSGFRLSVMLTPTRIILAVLPSTDCSLSPFHYFSLLFTSLLPVPLSSCCQRR